MTQSPVDAIDIAVRVTPNAAHDEVRGFVLDANGQRNVSVRVRAVPDKGRANKAVIALFATWAGCPKRDIDIIRGATARIKMLRVTGPADQLDRVRAQLEMLTDER